MLATSAERGASRLVPAVIPGPAGSLEALVRVPPRPAGAAVVAHPHPLHGGTMHTKVVHRTAKVLADRFDLLAVRFNFRGVGASAGVHDNGRGEVEDVLAAARFARRQQPDGPLVLAGFSFGSVCVLGAASRLRFDALLLLGVPLSLWNGENATLPDGLKVAWVQGEKDGFGSGAAAREVAARRGWSFAMIEGADHFFTGKLNEFEEAATDLIGAALRKAP